MLLSIFLTFHFYFTIFCCPDITRWTGTFQYHPPPTPTPKLSRATHTSTEFRPAACFLAQACDSWNAQSRQKKRCFSGKPVQEWLFSLKYHFLLLPCPPKKVMKADIIQTSTAFPQCPLRNDTSFLVWARLLGILGLHNARGSRVQPDLTSTFLPSHALVLMSSPQVCWR